MWKENHVERKSNVNSNTDLLLLQLLGNFYMVRLYLGVSHTVSDEIWDRGDYAFVDENHPMRLFFHTYSRSV